MKRCETRSRSSKKRGRKPKAPDPDLLNLIYELRKEVDDLKKQLAELQRSHSTPTPKHSLQAVNKAASEANERKRRAKNLIVRGISPPESGSSEDDTEQVKSFFAKVCPDVHVEKVQRLNTSKSKKGSDRPPSPAALVIFKDEEEQRVALKAARHHNSSDYKGVFAHEDRTEAQQLEYAEVAKEAKRLNEVLDKKKVLDQPFRYVVRGDRARCIDVSKSKQERKSVYVSDEALAQHIKFTTAELARARGAVNDSRRSTQHGSYASDSRVGNASA